MNVSRIYVNQCTCSCANLKACSTACHNLQTLTTLLKTKRGIWARKESRPARAEGGAAAQARS